MVTSPKPQAREIIHVSLWFCTNSAIGNRSVGTSFGDHAGVPVNSTSRAGQFAKAGTTTHAARASLTQPARVDASPGLT